MLIIQGHFYQLLIMGLTLPHNVSISSLTKILQVINVVGITAMILIIQDGLIGERLSQTQIFPVLLKQPEYLLVKQYPCTSIN